MKKLVIIGNSVMDVLASGVNEAVFTTGSLPVDDIKVSFGGDGLNEVMALAKLHQPAKLITKVGKDEAGSRIVDYLKRYEVDTSSLILDECSTSINIVLVDDKGERHFITNPEGSQRKLSLKDIPIDAIEEGSIVNLGSMFISNELSIQDMEVLFKELKQKNCIVTADMTKPKQGETLEDIKGLLPYVDYFFPNEEEIAMLTGVKDPLLNVMMLASAGAKCVVIKCGATGCIMGYEGHMYHIPAYKEAKCVDTTGAGDCFVAGFLWALSEGFDAIDCAYYGCALGSCSIEKLGATEDVQNKEEMERRYNEIKKYE